MLRNSAIHRLCVGVVLSVLFVGCQTHSPAHYVSPRVIGTVLDEQTRQPIGDVAVQRVVPDYEAGTLEQVKGGEILQRTMPARSKADGTFNLDSQKSVALFRDIAWFTVEISFDHRDYERFVTNYTPKMSTNSPTGEPVIYTGDILMTPKSN
ncbi:MAG TPA: hypothetical protein VFZ59_05600 [Verrucomicrobiae bacterium]|nr:hypothetical protein [Verrucomicrobiae bacterium]